MVEAKNLAITQNILKLIYRPVTIKGYSGKYLAKNADHVGFSKESGADVSAQWVVYPLANGNLCLKSCKDGFNLKITADQTSCENEDESHSE